MAKTFYLVRSEDDSGISGTGRVAQGIVFDNGKVALTWLSEHPSVTIYDNLGEVRAIHGHAGKTEVEIDPEWKRAFYELKQAVCSIDISTIVKDRLPSDGPARIHMSEKDQKS